MEADRLPPHHPGSGTGRFFFLSCLIFSLATALQLLRLLLHPAGIVRTGNHADLLFSIWRLAWFGHQAGADPLRIFDANIFYPNHLTLAYSDPAFFAGLAGWPLLTAFGSPTVAYNLVVMATFVTTGVVSALFFRELLRWLLPATGERTIQAAALIASFAFTFGSYRFAHFKTIEVLSCQWLGLLFLFLLRYARRGRVGDLALLSAGFFLQFLSSMTHAAYATLALAVFGTFLSLRDRTLLRPRSLALLAGAGIVVAALLLTIYHPFWELYREAGVSRSYGANVDFSARPDWFATVPRINAWHDAIFPGSSSTAGRAYPLFPGAALLVLAAFSFLLAPRSGPRKRSRATAFLAIGTLAATLLLAHEGAVKCGAAFFDEMDAPAKGFHGVEWTGGAASRWSQERFTVPLQNLVPGDDLLLLLRAATHRPPGVPRARLTGRIDGREAVDLELPKAGFRTYAVRIPGELITRPGTSRLDLVTNCWIPALSIGSSDSRELGVLFDALAVTRGGSVPISWRLPGPLKTVMDDWLLLLAAALWLILLLRLTRFLPTEQRAFLFLALLAALLALGPLVIHRGVVLGRGPYDLLYRGVFLFQAFRVPHRIIQITYFCLAALAAIGIVRLADRFRTPLLKAGAVALCAGAVLVDGFNTTTTLRTDSPRYAQPPAEVYRWLASQKGEFGLIELPIPRDAGGDAELMYWSTHHWKRLVNGYSGNLPKSYNQFQGAVDRIPDPWFFDEIRRMGVKYVVYHSAADGGRTLPIYSAARQEVRELVRFGSDIVYEVERYRPKR